MADFDNYKDINIRNNKTDKERFIVRILDEFSSLNNDEEKESELTTLAHRYSKMYNLPSEDLRDHTQMSGDIDLAAIAVMNEINFNESLKKLPNCLELTECDLPINTAVSTYTRLLDNRDRLMLLLRYILETRDHNKENNPIVIEKNVLYNILLRKDMDPSTEEETLSTYERGFITSLSSIINAKKGQNIEDVITNEEAVSLVLMIRKKDTKTAVERILKMFSNSGDGYISLDSGALQVLLDLITHKKVSKAFNTELFKQLTHEKSLELDKGPILIR